MARGTSVKYTTHPFTYATAGTDLFSKDDVQLLAQAVEDHNHDGTTKGAVLSTVGLPSAVILPSAIISGAAGGNEAGVGYASHLPYIGDGTIARVWGTFQIGRIVGDGILTAFDFGSISQAYETLEIEIMGRGSVAAAVQFITATFNGDGGANYDYALRRTSGNGTETDVSAVGQVLMELGYVAGATATAGLVGICRLSIPGYARTVFHKHIRSVGGYETAAAAATVYTYQGIGRWASTAAITRVTVAFNGDTLPTGVVATLYGIP